MLREDVPVLMDNACEHKPKISMFECYKCSQLTNQLKETLNELSLMKLITGILSEEIKILKQTPITDRSISDNRQDIRQLIITRKLKDLEERKLYLKVTLAAQ
jgi:hypothetical protein